jgi:hypothetical protein
VKFFRDDRGSERPMIGADECQPGEGEVRHHLQDSADPQAGHACCSASQRAAGKAADQGGGEAHALDDVGVVDDGESEI